MKKLFLIFLFLTYISEANEISKWSIADIYSMAQQSTISNLSYPIYHQTLKEDKWVSITTAWNTFIDATVDEKNNYIYILDEGTGGGSFSTQAAMWRDDTGDLLLIVSENGYNVAFPERSFLKAFRYMPISADTTPLGIRLVSPPIQNISLLDFMPKDMNIKDLHMLRQVSTTIFYKLPRNGTSIHVLLIVEDEFQNVSILEKCYYDKKTCREKREIYHNYYQNLKGKIYRDIELEWKEYRFTIKKKSRKEPIVENVWSDK